MHNCVLSHLVITTKLTSVYPHCRLVAAASSTDLGQPHVHSLVGLPNTLRGHEVVFVLQVVQVTVHVLQRMISLPVHTVRGSFQIISRCVVVDLRLVNEFLDVVDHDGVLDVVRVKHSQQVLTWMGFSKFFLQTYLFTFVGLGRHLNVKPGHVVVLFTSPKISLQIYRENTVYTRGIARFSRDFANNRDPLTEACYI